MLCVRSPPSLVEGGVGRHVVIDVQLRLESSDEIIT